MKKEKSKRASAPQLAEVRYHEAKRLLEQGETVRAKEICQALLKETPAFAEPHFLLGYIDLRAGALASAIAHFKELLADPSLKVSGYCNLGMAQRLAGRVDDAIASLTQATRLAPTDGAAWLELGRAWKMKTNIPQAVAAFRKALTHDPALADAHLELGITLAYAGQAGQDAQALAEATSQLIAFLQARPDHPQALLTLAKCYLSLGDHLRAHASFERAARVLPSAADAWIGLATLAERQGNLGAAREAIERGLSVSPADLELSLHKALLLERTNELKAARALLEVVKEKEPHHVGVLFALGRLEKRSNQLASARHYLEQALGHCHMPQQKPPILNLLAEVADKEGQPAKAYDLLLKSKDIRQKLPRSQQLDPEGYIEGLEASRRYFTAEMVKGWSAEVPAERQPMFLVGFPRSGTTLAEQIISVYPDVVVSEEAPVLEKIIRAFPQILKRPFIYPQDIGTLTPEEIRRLQNLYWDEMEKDLAIPLAGKRLLAKMPLNMTRLGLIYRLFPTAKILTIHRDPRDAILSCFFQNFTLSDAMLHFSTLGGSVRLYDEVMRLYGHYRMALPLSCHEVAYESLVKEPEPNMRAMVDFLGFEWDEACLHYYDKTYKRHISTPSYEAVTKPLYDRSIGRWKDYAAYLEPHLPVLAPYIRQWGYRE